MAAGNLLLNAYRILARAGVTEGMHIADFGCGSHGHLVVPASFSVGEKGKVYAVDLKKDALAMLHGHVRRLQAHHIDLVWGDYEREFGVQIPDASLDRIFFIHGMWSLANPDIATFEMKRLLKPGGRAVIIDWRPKIEHPIGPPCDWRKNPEVIMRHLAENGGKVVDKSSFSTTHWWVEAEFPQIFA